MTVARLVVVLTMTSGCASVFAGFSQLQTGSDLKHAEEVSCGSVVGPMLGGAALDVIGAGVAAGTGETLSSFDKVLIGAAAVDIAVATVITIRHCAR